MGRVQSAARNIVFGYIGNLTTQILGFVLRSIFIAHLGDTLNGVNDLYTSLLSVLSMAGVKLISEVKVLCAYDYNFKSWQENSRGTFEVIVSYPLFPAKCCLFP